MSGETEGATDWSSRPTGLSLGWLAGCPDDGGADVLGVIGTPAARLIRWPGCSVDPCEAQATHAVIRDVMPGAGPMIFPVCEPHALGAYRAIWGPSPRKYEYPVTG